MSKIIIDAPQAKGPKVPVVRVGKFAAIFVCTHVHYYTVLVELVFLLCR